MEVNVSTPVEDIDGQPLKMSMDRIIDSKIVKTSEAMTVADVLINVALSPAAPDKEGRPRSYTRRQNVVRFQLAINTKKAMDLDPPMIYVAKKIVDEISEDIARLYMPIVAGQVLILLGEEIPEEVLALLGEKTPKEVLEPTQK